MPGTLSSGRPCADICRIYRKKGLHRSPAEQHHETAGGSLSRTGAQESVRADKKEGGRAAVRRGNLRGGVGRRCSRRQAAAYGGPYYSAQAEADGMTTDGKTIRAAIYCRLSKEDEGARGESESIQNQKALLAAYAGERGWSVRGVYCDEDYSGADRERPGFCRLLEAAKAREFDVLLVKTQSRFTRDMELVERYIHGFFPLWGIRFIAVVDGVDTGVRGGKKARQINGLVNEWYLEDLSDNIRAVLDLKRRTGRFIGSFPPYGYRKDPADHNHLVPDPPAAEVVRAIFRRYIEGESTGQIAAALTREGVPTPTAYKRAAGLAYRNAGGGGEQGWSRATVGRLLRSRVYTGALVQGKRRKPSYKSSLLLSVPQDEWVVVPGTHEPLIGEDDFQAAARLLAGHTRSSGKGEKHRLAGLVRCMDCGSAMVKTSDTYKGATRAYLRCGRYAAGQGCDSHGVRLDRLEELVLGRLYALLEDAFSSDLLPNKPGKGARAALEREIDGVHTELRRREAALRELVLDKASGLLDDEAFRKLLEAFTGERRELADRLGRLEARLAQPPADREAGLAGWVSRDAFPRELAVRLIEAVEVGRRDRETGEQPVRIRWRI